MWANEGKHSSPSFSSRTFSLQQVRTNEKKCQKLNLIVCVGVSPVCAACILRILRALLPHLSTSQIGTQTTLITHLVYIKQEKMEKIRNWSSVYNQSSFGYNAFPHWVGAGPEDFIQFSLGKITPKGFIFQQDLIDKQLNMNYFCRYKIILG